MKHLKRIVLAATAAAIFALLAVGTASATTLEVGGVTKNESVSLTLSLRSGTSLTTKDTFGFSNNGCTTSEVKGATETPYTATTVTAKVPILTFASCERPVAVHTGGTLHAAHIAGTTNATVSSSGAEITNSSPFGTLNCKTGAGTHLGTLNGGASGHATMTINAILSCSGVSTLWSGTYTITSPTGFGVSA